MVTITLPAWLVYAALVSAAAIIWLWVESIRLQRHELQSRDDLIAEMRKETGLRQKVMEECADICERDGFQALLNEVNRNSQK
jgi:hypothetical protein